MGGCPAGFRWLWILYSNSNKIDKVIIKKIEKKQDHRRINRKRQLKKG